MGKVLCGRRGGGEGVGGLNEAGWICKRKGRGRLENAREDAQ